MTIRLAHANAGTAINYVTAVVGVVATGPRSRPTSRIIVIAIKKKNNNKNNRVGEKKNLSLQPGCDYTRECRSAFGGGRGAARPSIFRSLGFRRAEYRRDCGPFKGHRNGPEETDGRKSLKINIINSRDNKIQSDIFE